MPLFDTVKNFVQTPTESKVKQATDDNETTGATGTLMNEISVLTYSPKTLKDIIQVIKKRLSSATSSNKKLSHKTSVYIIKTLTLISYLINNGSNEFIEWLRLNFYLVENITKKCNFQLQDNSADSKMIGQIKVIAEDMTNLINNENLLEQRRKDVIQFRSSISSPGRKSTDNSHLRNSFTKSDVMMVNRSSSNSERYFIRRDNNDNGNGNTSSIAYRQSSSGNSNSIDLKRRPLKNTSDFLRTSSSRFRLDPLEEEESNLVDTSIDNTNDTYISEDNSYSHYLNETSNTLLETDNMDNSKKKFSLTNPFR
ncbi:Ent4p NDAI_0H00280 [Naumovozyma dairenensis CBS 421]|uniref:ENTH domain-containing protein n=1 Tax=Naumovozyma dairenensis (strain ATCC 10597 / BCRC 20456 / CBS 421 / NBRC 0211 / NRRL Y-12639) TaxID=1071378 RepID=G0WEJ1_NAUDC|nr:hypothetical protein NDAI_0H00280 [Naumovozyma dairenensis CBS 421]CCD26202.1 hypothetical protein NDAI_0H00280 [Naumovozyma dairenensis CBS 421]